MDKKNLKVLATETMSLLREKDTVYLTHIGIMWQYAPVVLTEFWTTFENNIQNHFNV